MPKFRCDDIGVDTDVKKLLKLNDGFIENNLTQIFAVTAYGRRDGLSTNAFNENDELVKFLQDEIKRGSEIALHNYMHIPADGDPDEEVWQIMKARDWLERALEVKIKYFVPPYHILGDGIGYWLKQIGMKVLMDKGQDIDELLEQNQIGSPKTEMFWYHWWKTDPDKLRQWLKHYQLS